MFAACPVSGATYFRWLKMCAHYGFSTDHDVVCGPCAVAMTEKDRETACPFNHAKGDSAHFPKVNGKLFDAAKEQKTFKAMGFLEVRRELIQERKEGKKPPGPPVKKNGALVYPTRHFA